MTIGSKFLERLTEAKSNKKAFTFDRGTEAMKRAMRDVGGENNFADKIAEVMNMIGIPGMYLNKPEVRESVLEAAANLRSKPARVAAFHALHDALASYRGVQLGEGKEQDLEGQGFQQLVEEILISLGLPESMATAEAAPAIKSGIKRTVAAAKSDANVRAAFIVFAQRAGIRLHDALVGAKKDVMAAVNAKKRAALGEEVEVDDTKVTAANAGLDAAREIMAAMGVNLNDEKMVRVVNQNMLDRSIRTATRAAVVKRAMAAFKRTMNSVQ